MPDPARVLIVDDSRIFRTALEQALTGQDGIAVVGSVFSGDKALEFLRTRAPDIVTLDVEMPGMDGLQTLKAIQRFNAEQGPNKEVGVIMVSAFTRRGADITVQALQAGAFDFVTKPSGPNTEANQNSLCHQLVAKIRLYMGRRRDLGGSSVRTPYRTAGPSVRIPRTIQVIAIAASTGGPKALEELLPDLCKRVAIPVMVVQHMPPPFTRSLAKNLARQTGLSVVEAGNNEKVLAKHVYIAPAGKHLVLRSYGGQLFTALNEQPPENGFRPSADVLFRSAAAVVGKAMAAIVLTGMACDSIADGTAGAAPVKRAGGYVLAQDEATSVVWGMPGSIVRAGLADEVLPLGSIAGAIQELAGG
jgi:two-component system chemotaxis response regulator CheB